MWVWQLCPGCRKVPLSPHYWTAFFEKVLEQFCEIKLGLGLAGAGLVECGNKCIHEVAINRGGCYLVIYHGWHCVQLRGAPSLPLPEMWQIDLTCHIFHTEFDSYFWHFLPANEIQLIPSWPKFFPLCEFWANSDLVYLRNDSRCFTYPKERKSKTMLFPIKLKMWKAKYHSRWRRLSWILSAEDGIQNSISSENIEYDIDR